MGINALSDTLIPIWDDIFWIIILAGPFAPRSTRHKENKSWRTL
jgi:hypothetical protein